MIVDTRQKISIGYPHCGLVRAEFLNAIVRMNVWEFSRFQNNRKYVIDSFTSAGSVYVSKNRNDLVRDFLKTNADWQLQLDTDVEFKPDLLKRLMDVADEEHKIVSGLYISYRKENPDADLILVPVLYHNAEDGKYTNINEIPPNSVIEVAMAGAGCLMVHRSVYEAMAEAYKDDPWTWYGHEPSQDKKEMLGEDVTFCKRATQLGFKIWADTGILLRHYKTVPLTIDEWWKELPQ
jgi:GT2 family glycosyltransferase